MSRRPDHVIDLVRERIDIVEIVSRYVTLKRSGRKMVGLCPFHTEKTPSFTVDREAQLFYCFGCQAGGDVFSFLMQLERSTFPEVLKHLADQAGVPIDEVEPSPEAARRRREWESLARAAEIAAAYYEQALREAAGAEARRYLRRRGLRPEVVRRFRIGYAPSGWGSLRDYLEAKGVPTDIGIKAGLLIQGRRGVYDRFRHRIVFPICDVKGRVVGFGGRALGADGVKYINSPESALYVKRSHLYGLNVAIAQRPLGRRWILVEGYMDVVTLSQYGCPHVVASLGTAFTPEQAKLLKRYAEEVILAYDADRAGEAAALRGLDVLAAEGLEVKVATLPEGEDPDSFVRRAGLLGLNQVFDAAKPLIEYKIWHALKGADLSTVEGRVAAVRRVVPVLAEIESPVAKEGYMEWTATRLDVSLQALAQELAQHEKGREKGGSSRHNLSIGRYTNMDSARAERRVRPLRPSAAAVPVDQGEKGHAAAARDLLAWLLREPSRVKQARQALGSDPFGSNEENRLFNWLVAQGECGESGESLVGRIEEKSLREFALSLLRGVRPPGPFDVYLSRAREELLRAEVEGVEARLELLMRDEWMTPQEVDRLLVLLKRTRDRLERKVRQGNAS